MGGCRRRRQPLPAELGCMLACCLPVRLPPSPLPPPITGLGERRGRSQGAGGDAQPHLCPAAGLKVPERYILWGESVGPGWAGARGLLLHGLLPCGGPPPTGGSVSAGSSCRHSVHACICRVSRLNGSPSLPCRCLRLPACATLLLPVAAAGLQNFTKEVHGVGHRVVHGREISEPVLIR